MQYTQTRPAYAGEHPCGHEFCHKQATYLVEYTGSHSYQCGDHVGLDALRVKRLRPPPGSDADRVYLTPTGAALARTL